MQHSRLSNLTTPTKHKALDLHIKIGSKELIIVHSMG